MCLHSLDSFAATVLAAEIIYGHSLDVTEFCHCDDCIFSRNQVFHRNVICVKSDCCSSVVTVFFAKLQGFLHGSRRRSCVSRLPELLLILQIFSINSAYSCFQLLSFQTGKSTKTHVYDCLCLYISQVQNAPSIRCLATCYTSGTTDNADDFINIIQVRSASPLKYGHVLPLYSDHIWYVW